MSIDLHLKGPTPSPSHSRRESVASLAHAFLFEKKSTMQPESITNSPKNNSQFNSPLLDEPPEIVLIDETLYLDRCKAIVE